MNPTVSPFRRIAIVGLGLLGASLAEAVRRRFNGVTLVGVSSAKSLDEAHKAGLIQKTLPYDRIDEALSQVDLLILCTPIDRIKEQLRRWSEHAPSLSSPCIVTDVGSTKREIGIMGAKAFPPGSQGLFIGSHPMAGSEKRGFAARDAHLFENAAWILCPPDFSPREPVERFQEFLLALGARPIEMEAGMHDRVAAHVSHLPQLIASTLARFIGLREEIREHCLKLAGGGFRDMTRLADSSHDVWNPILKTNAAGIEEALNGFCAQLSQTGQEHRAGETKDLFNDAGALRSRLQSSKKGFSYALTEILVNLQDKPGALLEVLTPLAAKNLNILDLEILKVREGEDGTLMMAFKTQHEATDAVTVLTGLGVEARFR